MATTTSSACRASVRTYLQAIVPTYAKYQTHKWRYVTTPGEVPGPELRRFTLLAEPTEVDPPDEVVFGDGVSFNFELDILTGYGQLHALEDELMIDEDTRDVWLALEAAKNSNSGIINFTFPVWIQDPDADDGIVWGVYRTTCRYFGRNS